MQIRSLWGATKAGERWTQGGFFTIYIYKCRPQRAVKRLFCAIIPWVVVLQTAPKMLHWNDQSRLGFFFCFGLGFFLSFSPFRNDRGILRRCPRRRVASRTRRGLTGRKNNANRRKGGNSRVSVVRKSRGTPAVIGEGGGKRWVTANSPECL